MLVGRRDFLKSLGILGVGSMVACNGAPLEKLYAYLTPPKDIVPGIPAFYATVCRACPAGCGVIVKTREARPIKLEGNPSHPVNRGALCARGQAFIQGLYSPSRVTEPLIRKDGVLTAVSWERAMAALAELLANSPSIGLLTGLESGTFLDLATEFGSKFPFASHLMYEPAGMTSIAKASSILLNRAEVPRFDPAGADYIVSIGADFLDAWLSPVEFTRKWADAHAFNGDRTLEVDYLGPRRNLTATSADRFHVLPQSEVGSAIRYLLADVTGFPAAQQTPETMVVGQVILERLAAAPELSERTALFLAGVSRRLLAARNPLILFGGPDVLTQNATLLHAATLAMNIRLGAAGRAIRFGEQYAWSRLAAESRILDMINSAASGQIDTLIVWGANPVATLPGEAAVAKRLEEAKSVVVLAAEMDETAAAADIVLPVHHPLECWGDYDLTDGIQGILQPVRQPVCRSMHPADLLIEAASRAGRPLRHREYKKCILDHWADRTDSLNRTLIAGGRFPDPPPPYPVFPLTANLDQLPLYAPEPATSGALLIAPFSSLLYDGRSAGASWLHETPDSLNQTAWEAPIELGNTLAESLGVRTGDRVTIGNAGSSVTAPALIVDDIAPEAVALRFGGGRLAHRDSVPSGNVASLFGLRFDPVSGELATAGHRVSIARSGPGELVSVMGSPFSDGRALCLAMPLSKAREGAFPKMTRHGEEYPDAHGHVHGPVVPMPHEEKGGERPADNIVPLQEHPQHRWGLVIDLDRCTGCGACVTACYAENNIPVVGREEIARGRELSWIRIEKHILKSEPGAHVRFLPVMCQHCDQAPCETVCPVFASYHTPDGLNAQVYNRCIGTRYCANNCPYKVRRFNYFDYPRVSPGNEQLNPDVTVRSRGVMEKCSFCVQRIREATNRAKFERRGVRDGEIVPACVQTCPAGALAFGDFLQPDWRMTALARDPRGYRLLDYYTNTRPGVVYLRKVFLDGEAT